MEKGKGGKAGSDETSSVCNLESRSKIVTVAGMSRESEHRIYHEVFGLLLLGAGTLLFLALVSYDARDIPPGSWLACTSETNRHAHNFVGIAGAYVGGLFYFLFGAAAFLVSFYHKKF
jgi:hypothetical protein